MKITIEEPLKAYMQNCGKHTIAVEIASSEHSDFDVTELHVHLVNEKTRKFMLEKQKFHEKETEGGTVLFPNYRLDYDEEIVFSLKSFGPIRWVKQKGIHL